MACYFDYSNITSFTMAHAMIHHDTIISNDGITNHLNHHTPVHNTGPLPPHPGSYYPQHNHHHNSNHGSFYLGTDGNGHDCYGGLLIPDFGHTGAQNGSHVGTFVW